MDADGLELIWHQDICNVQLWGILVGEDLEYNVMIT